MFWRKTALILGGLGLAGLAESPWVHAAAHASVDIRAVVNLALLASGILVAAGIWLRAKPHLGPV